VREGHGDDSSTGAATTQRRQRYAMLWPPV